MSAPTDMQLLAAFQQRLIEAAGDVLDLCEALGKPLDRPMDLWVRVEPGDPATGGRARIVGTHVGSPGSHRPFL